MRRSRALLVLALAALAIVVAWAVSTEDADRGDEAAPVIAAQQPVEEEGAPREPVREHVTATEPADEEPAEGHSLTVTVTRPGGAPVAGARIVVASRSRDWGAQPHEVRQDVTDSSGRVEITLPPGSYAVRGSHADLQILGAEIDVPKDESVELDAAAGPRVTIVVRDEADAPIAGAVAWERHSHAGAVATTDADGRAELGRVYPSNPFVEVAAPGYARWSNYVFGTWDGRDEYVYRVKLRRATDVTVRVIEHDGTPAEGALLVCGGTRDLCDAGGMGRVRVGEFGDGCWLRAEHADGRDVRRQLVEPPADGEIVSVQLPELEPLRGRVVHAWTGEPVPGARVLVNPDQETEYTLAADTNEVGEFELPHVTRDVKIVAFAPGLARSGEDWADIEPDEDGAYTIVVAPTMRVSGRVVDKDGEPLAEARLWLVTWGEPAPMAASPVELTSAADGTFAFDGVPAVPDVIVMAQSGRGVGWSGIDLELAPTPDAQHHVGDIVIPDGFDLDVPVTDDDGEPLAAGIVWVRWRIVGQGMPAAHRQVLDGAIDAIDGIPQDGAVAEVTAPGCLKTVRRIDASTTSLVVDRPCTVRGRVARADGTPVADVWVVIESKDQLHTLDGNHGGAKTSADGRFSFGGVRRARYRLSLRREDDPRRIESDTTELDVRVREVDVGTITME